MSGRLLGPYTVGRVYHGDARELGARVPDGSVDLVFTDPPYLREFVPLYGWLAEWGARVLRPGGFVLAMGGGLYTDEIMHLMSAHLTYYWTFHVALTDSAAGKVHPGGNHTPIITRVKPVYAFVKGWGSPRTVVYDPFAGDGNDKRWHHWGQDMRSARYYIDCFTRERDLVIDPFCGGGTTAVVCKHLKRRWLAFDSDATAVETARGRVRNPFYTPHGESEQMVLEFAA